MHVARLLLPVLTVLVAGCMREEPLTITADEQVLLDKLTVDPFVRVQSMRRLPDREGRPTGVLEVTTSQGETVVRYRLDPALAKAGQRAIVPIDPDVRLRVRDDGRLGTGPEPRGLDP